MRGTEQTFSRLSVSPVRVLRALIAGAAFLAGATASVASTPQLGTGPEGSGNGDDTAMAMPGRAPGAGGATALPRPLAPSQSVLIRRIFTLQASGNIPEAVAETSRLTDRSLLGHILADRYLGRFLRPSSADLAIWIDRYDDHPDAPSIRSLLTWRRPKARGAAPENSSESASLTASGGGAFEDAEIDPPGPSIPRNPQLDRTVVSRARDGKASSALRLIARTRGLSPEYGATLRAELAQILFTLNSDEQALEIAGNVVRHSQRGRSVGLAGYIAGLAAWRLDRPSLARDYFEAAYTADIATNSLRAASAFWAARAHLRSGDPSGYAPWMKNAAAQRTTFHGMLARRALGLGNDFSRSREVLAQADIDAVAETPQGMRAFALLQVGQTERAEAELRLLANAIHDTPALSRAVMLVATAAGLDHLAARLADAAQQGDGRPRDFERLRVPSLRPRGGFRIDPALIYALTRQESNFKPEAVSPAGARGLMQIMPETAGYIVGDPDAAHAVRLHDPSVNLDLGQRYMEYLSTHELVGGDLIRLLASYNAGPGSFARWGPAIRDGGDPLLLIEAIPLDETRAFVQHVLAYTWMYAARLQLPAPSLDELAAGAFPRFTTAHKDASLLIAAPTLH